MNSPVIKGGQRGIKNKVLQQELCTGCSACVNLCPYLKNYKDSTILLHDCDQLSGRCYDYCPRTPLSLDVLAKAMFDPKDLTPEMGSFKGLFITRATDSDIRSQAQHGGTVTALIQLALKEGLIDAAILSQQGNQHLLPQGTVVEDPANVSSNSKSKFVVSPNLAAFNQASLGSTEKFGIVATPCQALAIAKMKHYAPDSDRKRVEKMRLVIGLFCGWALDWKKLKQLLSKKVGEAEICGIDIPPSRHACMEVYTSVGTIVVPIDKVNDAVRENCRYCFDLTCEFSDISVGSARSPEGWEVDRHWNQVIVRSSLGEQLINLARERGVLEFKAVPQGNIEKLKKASAKKKLSCLKNLMQKSGNDKDLIYLNSFDSMWKTINTYLIQRDKVADQGSGV